MCHSPGRPSWFTCVLLFSPICYGTQSSKPFKWFVLRDIWSDDAVQRLFRVMEERGKTGFVTAAEDFTAAAEDIGESQPLTATGMSYMHMITSLILTRGVIAG
mgnify:CR=1 FL=1